jgi:1,4-alpha-glucan branching enzyme
MAKELLQNAPMGSNLVGQKATFKVWAPNAKAVFVTGRLEYRTTRITVVRKRKMGD